MPSASRSSVNIIRFLKLVIMLLHDFNSSCSISLDSTTWSYASSYGKSCASIPPHLLSMWQESESRQSDFPRVASLVRSHVKIALEDESSSNWLTLEADLFQSDYRNIRDRQMEMLEKEDGMLNRPAVMGLRDRLYGDAYELMTEQRYARKSSPTDVTELDVCCKGVGLIRRS